MQIFGTLLATSLIPYSCLLQHNATIGKDKDNNVITAPNYLFYTQLNLLVCGALRRCINNRYLPPSRSWANLLLYRSTVHAHCSTWFCRTVLYSPGLILRNNGVLQHHFILSRFNTRRAPFCAIRGKQVNTLGEIWIMVCCDTILCCPGLIVEENHFVFCMVITSNETKLMVCCSTILCYTGLVG
jgi:hypothetical protein